jgi:hypothetical protein
LFANGYYEAISNMSSLTQTLLQLFLPMPEDRRFSKSYMLVKNDKIVCDVCKNDADKPVMNSETRISIIC